MRKIFAVIICAVMLITLCSCTKIIVDVVYDEQPSREVAVTLPPETEPPTEPPTEPSTELTTAPNVNTGEQQF